MIALLAAIRDELAPTLKRIGFETVGERAHATVNGRQIVAAVGGIGPQRIIKCLDELLAATPIDHVILAGFAGGLDPALVPGDVPALNVVTNEQGRAIQINNGVPQVLPASDVGEPVAQERCDPAGTLLTLDRIADSPRVKAALHARHHASLVDMETFAVAEHAADRGVPLTVLRAVSDPAGMALPAAALDWVTPQGAPDKAAAARYLASRPWKLPTLLRLQRHAALAAERLADRIEATITRITS